MEKKKDLQVEQMISIQICVFFELLHDFSSSNQFMMKSRVLF